MKLNALFSSILAVGLFASSVVAQTAPSSALTTGVDDLTAYRMVFLTSCIRPTDTDAEVAAKRLHLGELPGVTVQKTVDNFCAAFDRMIARYNTTVGSDKIGTQQINFVTERDTLVQATVGKLQKANAANWSLIYNFVQRQKQRMGILPTSMTVTQTPQLTNNEMAPLADITGGSIGYTYSISYAVDAAYIYQTVLIDGTLSASGMCIFDQYHQMWQPPNCNNGTHQPSISNVLWGSGGTQYGSVVPYNGYISFQTTAAVPLLEGDNPPLSYGDSSGFVQVYCSIARGFVVSWPWRFHLMAAFTKTKQPYPDSCDLTPIEICTPDTTPPLAPTIKHIQDYGCAWDAHWSVTPCWDNNDYHYIYCSLIHYDYGASTDTPSACTGPASKYR